MWLKHKESSTAVAQHIFDAIHVPHLLPAWHNAASRERRLHSGIDATSLQVKRLLAHACSSGSQWQHHTTDMHKGAQTRVHTRTRMHTLKVHTQGCTHGQGCTHKGAHANKFAHTNGPQQAHVSNLRTAYSKRSKDALLACQLQAHNTIQYMFRVGT
jgi:hypothetical protein